MRLVVLMVSAIAAVAAGVVYVVWQQRQSAGLAEQRAAFEARMRCLEAERRLADYKAGTGANYGESEAVTRVRVDLPRAALRDRPGRPLTGPARARRRRRPTPRRRGPRAGSRLGAELGYHRGSALWTGAATMIETRTVTCPECGFQALDRGPLDWPVFTGEVGPYADRCRHLDEAPEPPDQAFYCMNLRTAAKRAAMAAGIERVGRPAAHPATGVPPAVEKTGDVIGEP